MTDIDLKQAIQSNSVELVKTAIASGIDVNAPFVSVGYSQIPILYACDCLKLNTESREIIQLFINAGVDLSVTDKFGDNAMNIAVFRGNADIVELLKSNGHTISSHCSLIKFISRRQRHAFYDQREGYHKILKCLLEEKPELELTADGAKTALHLACSNGFQQEIEWLLLAGANPNCKDSTGNSPLAYIANFAWRAQLDCIFPIYHLIKCGADIDNLGDEKESETALSWATLYGGNTLTVVTHLLESGANPNKQNHQGKTPLMHASCSNRVDLVQVLLFFGAKIEHQDQQGKTALDYAIEDKRQDVVNFLKTYQS